MADEDELVLEPGTFTGPERRLMQQHLKVPFADLVTYVYRAALRLHADDDQGEPRVLVAAGGAFVFPDEVMQAMAWVQARRADPEAKVEDFDHLTMRDLNRALTRGTRGKAGGPETSTTSLPESPSADSSPA